MDSADALNNEVHRSDIGDEEISIDVEALLRNLGGYDDEAIRTVAAPMSIWAKLVAQFCLLTGAVRSHESRVMKLYLAGEFRLKSLESMLCSLYCVAHDQSNSTVGKLTGEKGDKGGIIVGKLFDEKMGAVGANLHRMLLKTGPINDRDEWVCLRLHRRRRNVKTMCERSDERLSLCDRERSTHYDHGTAISSKPLKSFA